MECESNGDNDGEELDCVVSGGNESTWIKSPVPVAHTIAEREGQGIS